MFDKLQGNFRSNNVGLKFVFHVGSAILYLDIFKFWFPCKNFKITTSRTKIEYNFSFATIVKNRYPVRYAAVTVHCFM